MLTAGERCHSAAGVAPISTRGMAMDRRAFIAGSAVWSLVSPSGAPGQQETRRIAVLMGHAETDPVARARVAGLESGMRELGWVEGRNIRVDRRWPATDPERMSKHAEEIVRLAPEVIVSSPSQMTLVLSKFTTTTPIVFVNVPDPVALGLVSNLARPEGNMTGFANFEHLLAGKWLEILKEMAPGAVRVGVLYSEENPAWRGRLQVMETAAPSLGVQLLPAAATKESDIEPAFALIVRNKADAVVVLPSVIAAAHRAPIIALAARHRLPAMYPFRFFVTQGGLLAYGVDVVDQFRRAAGYVDRILRGAKPSELPVQQPTKYEMTINLKTAKALGLTIPPSVLARADEIIHQ
jgi:putative ABC transport system substrate-binding protein